MKNWRKMINSLAHDLKSPFKSILVLIILSLNLVNMLGADVASGTGTLEFDSNADGISEMNLTSAGLAVSSHVTSANLHVGGNAMISQSLSVGSSLSRSANLNISGTIGFSLGSYTGNVGINESNLHSMLLIDNSSGNCTIVLPDPSMVTGRKMTIKARSSGFDLNLHTYTGNIDGDQNQRVTSSVIAPYVILYADGTNWSILSQSGPQESKTYFELIVKTDETGTSSSTQFTLPLVGSLTYNFDIDWGDGNTETVTSSTSPTHTYASAGTYNIRITENTIRGFPTLRFDNGGDRYKLLYINNWGNNTWTTMEKSFRGCGNMQLTANDLPVTGEVTAFQYSFGDCKSITSFPQMNMSHGTSVRDMFWQCNHLAALPLLQTSQVTNWENFVRGCNSLASFPLLDTSSGTNFAGFVRDCSSITSFPLIDTSSGTNFFWAFSGTAGLTGTDFPLLNFGSASGSTSLERALPAPSLNSYSALLIDIESKNSNSNIFLSYEGNWNTSANTARDLLIARGWTFGGSGVYTP